MTDAEQLPGVPGFDQSGDTGFDTLAVRAGNIRSEHGEHSEVMFLTSSFVFRSAAEAAARFGGTDKGNVYSRFTNPTVRAFEERLAALEGGERAVATSSGMAAILAMVLGLLKAGDEVVTSQSLFGTTNVLFDKYARKFGIVTRFVPLADLSAWREAITPATRLFFLETPSNPLGELVDIAALAELAHAHDILLAVDNCFCTPALQRPLAMGADLVIHSATKYLDGQGRCLGGAVVGRDKLMEEIFGVVRTCGPSLSPFNAWVFLKGLETLRLRMDAHSRQALALAQWLEAQPQVAAVHYPGLQSHPQHALATRQQRGYGGVLSFEVKARPGETGREAAWRFIDATEVMSITANLGDAKTTITHPGSTTHGRLSPEAKAAARISDGLIRIAVGLEDIDDLIADCSRGFAAC
ncbi:O-succinylhomoserine sulfhydrylase [Amnimonas aquatica]|uniref:O-succinylhomoserine sulfhydrylase n=1 Tax=Amnimonas aquatica TaxID=2094561 RepID=A0A2P6ARR1_9GAMM|nr:O-succinylhomoserine sulfhydrylase [Amnimonas aquatica]PQA38036.1 O-succinylhomoserine sulfhydrylase [Amnimonas aquatica]